MTTTAQAQNSFISGILPSSDTVLASAARTATATSETMGNNGGCNLIVTLVATALANSPSITLGVQGYDPASGSWYTIVTSAAVTTASPTTKQVFVGSALAASTNVAANVPLPDKWRVVVTHSNSDSITYSVGATLCP